MLNYSPELLNFSFNIQFAVYVSNQGREDFNYYFFAEVSIK
jgi:hypothetical protein